MFIKFPCILLFLLLFIPLEAQEQVFGKLTEDERAFAKYEKDSAAHAVVLYEKGVFHFELINRRFHLIKKYHVKIKILDRQGLDEAEISAKYYRNDEASEKLVGLEALTHNGNRKSYLSDDEIYSTDINERWSEKKFTFPNTQIGSILEYKYTLITPFLYNLDGWTFQSNIPKLYSEFNAKIPGNYKYNRLLIGALQLDINEATREKDCFEVWNYGKLKYDCEVLKYVLKDIPAFKEAENYMLAPSNYISRLDFELAEYYDVTGRRKKFTKSWEDVDREFKEDKDIGKQLTKKNFFERKVPDSILVESNELTRAQNIYRFVQDYYTWNGKYSTYGKARVKDAFNAKKGNAWEINMSLINLLNAAGIKANLMLSSTRKNGLPKKNHNPIISDFNYVLAKVTINQKDYLLDATNKYIPFGVLPFRALNYYGRVMDFQKESFWFDIAPETKNLYQIRGQVTFDIERQKGYGNLNVLKSGYNAVSTYEKISKNTQDEYLKEWESIFEITDYRMIPERSNDSKISEQFEFELQNVSSTGDFFYFNPFLVLFFEKNPFVLEERYYPVDFGYPRSFKYSINIVIPEGYEVHKLPEKRAVQMGDKMVVLKFIHRQYSNQISLSFDLILNSTHIEADNYQSLKDIFKHVTDIQKNSLVVLKKK